jgi:hypothetical protein
MAYTRTFCCCLPVRLGVFALTILNLFGGVSFAILGWTQVTHLRNVPLATQDEIALVIHSVVFTALAAISLLGLIGAIIKHRSLVSSFSMILLAFLCISIGTGIYTIYSLYRDQGQALIQACLSGASDFSPESCRAAASLTQAIIVLIYIAIWLLQFCEWQIHETIMLPNTRLTGGFIIVRDYCHQLDDEEEEGLKPRIEPLMVGKPRSDGAVIAPRLPNRSEV